MATWAFLLYLTAGFTLLTLFNVAWAVVFLPVAQWPSLVRAVRGVVYCSRPWQCQTGWFSVCQPAHIRYLTYLECISSGSERPTSLYQYPDLSRGLRNLVLSSLLAYTLVKYARPLAFSLWHRLTRLTITSLRGHMPRSLRNIAGSIPMPTVEEMARASDRGNPHRLGAQRRRVATKLMLDFALRVFGSDEVVVAYDCGYSPRDEEYAAGRVIGRRRFHTERDILQPARDDPLPTHDCLVFMVDQAHYLSVEDFDEFAGRPIAYNTIVPIAAAWRTGYSTVAVEADSTITEHIIEQEVPYTHPLWSVDTHAMWLYGRFSVVRYESVVRRISDDMAVVFWIPMAKVSLPPLLFRFLMACINKPIPRMQKWAAAKRVVHTTSEGSSISLVQVPVGGKVTVRYEDDYSGDCTVLDARALKTIATRASLSGGKVHIMETADLLRNFDPDRAIPTPDASTAAAVIAGAKVDVRLPPAFIPGAAVEANGAKNPVREVEEHPPVVPPAFVAANHPNTLTALREAALKAAANHPRDVPDDVRSALDEALALIVSAVGKVSPLDLEEVVAAQEKPLQKARNIKALAQDFAIQMQAKLMRKTEATEKPKERGIVMVNTQYGLLFGRYTRALYARMKEVFPSWAPGRTAHDLCTAVCSCVSRFGGLASTDVSGMDNSVGAILHGYWATFVLSVFDQGEDSDLARYLNLESRAFVRIPGQPGYRTDGNTISGNPDTTVRNTFIVLLEMAAAEVLRARQEGRTHTYESLIPELGLVSGDDACVNPGHLDEFKAVCSAMHMELKFDELAPGMVKFLNRTWLSPLVSSHNVPSLERLLVRLPVYTGADGRPEDRTAGLEVSDGNTPFIRELIQARKRCLGHVQGVASPDKEAVGLWNEEEFNESHERLAYLAYSLDMGVSIEALSAVAHQLSTARTEADYGAIMPIKERATPPAKSGEITSVVAPQARKEAAAHVKERVTPPAKAGEAAKVAPAHASKDASATASKPSPGPKAAVKKKPAAKGVPPKAVRARG